MQGVESKCGRLIVMRHAKSSWDSNAPDDHSRPLNKRGCRDAPRIAERLAEMGWTPELVLSSDSQRTRETCELMLPKFVTQPEVQFLPSLYHSGPSDVAACLSSVPPQINSLMVLGHNPGWESVVLYLSGKEITMTTANAALLELDTTSWESTFDNEGNWNLVEVLRPKELDERSV